MSRKRPPFEPYRHEPQLVPLIHDIVAEERLDSHKLHCLVRAHPKEGGGAFSKSEIIRAFRLFSGRYTFAQDEAAFVERIRMKPIRTGSGVAPVTVLTKPFPCPGKCIFCPSDVRMPKSYLTREPGAQRAAQHRFDPYAQTLSRLIAFHHTGHEVDKVELIILGGTWSFYPEPYQIWFVKRCFDAMNDFINIRPSVEDFAGPAPGAIKFDQLADEVDGRTLDRTYNQVVTAFLRAQMDGELTDEAEVASWEELVAAQHTNETTLARCVGLVVETRPDQVSPEEVLRIRRLGATKVQLGLQSLSDDVLEKNRRGHDVETSRQALGLLRRAGFKLHVHWMPNLYGSNPAADVKDFRRLFDDPAIRPDELKIYPCSLIESAELMQRYQDGSWQPYSEEELLGVLTDAFLQVEPYCRVTRMIRDIPGDEIVAGNRKTNFREVVERELERRGHRSRDIRAREIRGATIEADRLRLESLVYETSSGREIFLQWLHGEDQEERLVGFCRLALPSGPSFLPELGRAALLREVHVYGAVVALGKAGGSRAQHLGLGRKLIDEAARLATAEGYDELVVISSIGTREYYRRRGFVDGELYQHRSLVE
jgi:elongator complex protein 3